MKVSLATLLALALAVACLVCISDAQGVKGAAEDAASLEMEELEEEEDFEGMSLFERELAKKQRFKKRCPYPGEIDDDWECDATSLYKPDKWCKKYCKSFHFHFNVMTSVLYPYSFPN